MSELEKLPLEEQKAITNIMEAFTQDPADLSFDPLAQPPMELPVAEDPAPEASDHTKSVVLDWMLGQLESAFIAYAVEDTGLQSNITDAVMATALAGKLGDGSMSGETSAAINQQVEQLISSEFGTMQVPQIVAPSVMGFMGIGESASVWGEKGNGFDQDPDKVLDSQQQETLDYAKQELGGTWEAKLKKIWGEESYNAYPDCFDEVDINTLEQVKILMGGELKGLKADAKNVQRPCNEDRTQEFLQDVERRDNLRVRKDILFDKLSGRKSRITRSDVMLNFPESDDDVDRTEVARQWTEELEDREGTKRSRQFGESRDDTDEFMLEVDNIEYLYDKKMDLFRVASRRQGMRVFSSDIARYFNVPRGVNRNQVAADWTEELIYDMDRGAGPSRNESRNIMAEAKKKAEPKDSLAFIFDLIGIDLSEGVDAAIVKRVLENRKAK